MGKRFPLVFNRRRLRVPGEKRAEVVRDAIDQKRQENNEIDEGKLRGKSGKSLLRQRKRQKDKGRA